MLPIVLFGAACRLTVTVGARMNARGLGGGMTNNDEQSSSPTSPADLGAARRREPIFTRKALVVLPLIFAFFFVVIKASERPEARPKPPPWVPPAGYELQNADEGSRTAYQWSKPNDPQCILGPCFAVNVVAERGCPSGLRVDVTFLDAEKRNIGSDYEIIEVLRPDEIGHVVFNLKLAADTARIENITCN